jgi:DNA replication and repair protein RecF
MASGITSIVAHGFRSYENFQVTMDSLPVVLYGENGAGKTNILEALSLFAPGKGLRGATTDDLRKQDCQTPWHIRLKIDHDVTLATGVMVKDGKDKRIWKAQGEPLKSQTELSEYLKILWFTPETDRLFLDSPQIRRRFVDRFVYAIDPLHIKRLNRYDHAVKQRLQTLKFGGEKAWLFALEKTIVSEGAAIMVTRKNFLSLLSEQSCLNASVLPAFHATMGEDFLKLHMDALDIEQSYLNQLELNRPRDRESGMTNLGPHRHDLSLLHLGKNMRAQFCSTGEQKILLLSFLIAFIDKFCLDDEKLTLFLLDDIIAHLDFNHRMLLFDRICTTHSVGNRPCRFQTWMTGTDRDFFEPLKNRAQFFHVNNGSITLV